MKGNLQHPGISMHKMPVGGDGGGLLVVVACIAVVLVGVPSAWYFFALAVLGGLAIAGILLWIHPGITVSRIRAAGGVWGLLFIAAAAVVILVGGSTIKYFFVLAVTGGLAVFGILRWLNRERTGY